jgi:hypothetical protein
MSERKRDELRDHRHCHNCKRVFFLDEFKSTDSNPNVMVYACPDCGRETFGVGVGIMSGRGNLLRKRK